MPRCLLLGMAAVVSSVLTAATSWGAIPSGGTVSPSSPLLTYVAGPFNGSNPSNNIQDEPDCDLVPNTCDDFTLTINIPAGYTATHPNDVVVVKIQWPGGVASDFDVYFQNPGNGTRAYPPAATGGDPEIGTIPLEDGVRTVRIRVLAFRAVNESFTGTISIQTTNTSTFGLGTYLASTDVWSCNKHLGDENAKVPPAFDHNGDGEPAVRFDGNGKGYVSAIAGVPAGAGLWVVNDACGQTYQFWGAPDENVGGGDTDIETAPEKNALGFYNVYASSLTLANVTMSVSPDGGETFTTQPIATVTPVVDRQWLAAHGANTVYLSYRNGALDPGNFLEVVRWDNGGVGSPGAGPFVIWDPTAVDPTTAKDMGNIATDRRPVPSGTLPLTAGPDGEGNVYHGWSESNHKVWVSGSKDFGVHWAHHLVVDGGEGGNYSHLFTWVAVDQAGNVYTVFSDDRSIYYSVSQDQGDHWSRPVRVSNGNDTRSSVFPNVDAGSEGRILVSWYGTSALSAQNSTNPRQQWYAFVARCDNALDPAPTFEQVRVSDRVIHTGIACQEGLGCDPCPAGEPNCRALTECFEVGIDPQDGSGLAAFAAFADGGTWIARQVSGKSSIAGKMVIDRSLQCPSPANGCVSNLAGSPCILPGVLLDDDTAAADLPPVTDPQLDIQSLHIAEPYGSNNVVFTIKVASLDPQNLPANGMWRILYTSGGSLRYVLMQKCATAAQPTFEYGICTTGCSTSGSIPGTFSADGTIRFTVNRALIGNPAPGSLFTGVSAETDIRSGNCPGGPAGFATVDESTSAAYPVVGNAYCTPLSVACPPDFTDTPGDHVVNFQVTNPSTANRLVHVTVSDPNGWIVGGPISTSVGPVAPSATATVPVTVRFDQNCQPSDTDPLLFHVAASDLPDAAECTTVATCRGVTGAPEAARELSFAVIGANPSRGGTTLSFALPSRMPVQIELFGLDGRRLRTLVNEVRDAGGYTLPLRFGEGDGAYVGPGVYFVRMTAGTATRRLRVVALE